MNWLIKMCENSITIECSQLTLDFIFEKSFLENIYYI